MRKHIWDRLGKEPVLLGSIPGTLNEMTDRLGAALCERDTAAPLGVPVSPETAVAQPVGTAMAPHHTKRPADAAPEERPAKQRVVAPPPDISPTLAGQLKCQIEAAQKAKRDAEQQLAEQQQLIKDLERKQEASQNMVAMTRQE